MGGIQQKETGQICLVSVRHSSAHTLGWRFFYGVKMGSSLASISKAKNALALAKGLPDILEIRDKAEAVRGIREGF